MTKLDRTIIKIRTWIIKVASVLSILTVFAIVGGLIYIHPDSEPGNICLMLEYSLRSKNLENIRSHLYLVGGGYLPEKFDIFLIDRLKDPNILPAERNDIIGFYALQSLNSRQGSFISKQKQYLDLVVDLGLKQTERKLAEGYVVLAMSMIRGSNLYKPFLSSPQDPHDALQKIKAGLALEVEIVEP